MVNESSLTITQFRWLSGQEIDSYDLFQTGKNTKHGYILWKTVDMEYPAHLHDAHNIYPLAPLSSSNTGFSTGTMVLRVH